MIHAKSERNYRPGRKDAACKLCGNYQPDFPVRSCGRPAEVLKHEGRCKLVGLRSGRSYRILPGYVCDDYEEQEPQD